MTSSPLPTTAEAAIDGARERAIRDAARYAIDWMRFQAEQVGVPGFQAAIRYRGDLLEEAAWGVADAVTGEELTTTHLFRIASHSKMFTATAILQLAERGDLRLDDTVGRWIPALADAAVAPVTVRELLGHQGGVIRDGVDADYWQRGGPFPDQEALVRIASADGRVYARNEHFKYTNIGYGLLGLIVEAASGIGYDEYTRRNIVDPLGLIRSGSEWEAARATEYAAGHTGRIAHGDARRVVTHVDTAALASATGWYSTAAEVSAFVAAHALGTAKLLGDDAKRLAQRRESTVPIGPMTRHYGLGFELRELDGTDLVGHSGGYPGHITRTWLDPSSEIVVSVLTNAIDGPADALATGAVSLVRLAIETAQKEGTASAGFTGRFASLWSVLDIVDLGGATVGLRPGLADPASFVEELESDETGLRLARKASFGASGERVTVARDAAGAVESVVWNGMTMWPIETFQTAMSQPDPQPTLVRMAL